MAQYIPVIIFFIIAVLLAAGLLASATFIGTRNPTPVKKIPFECGETQIVSPQQRFSIKFYLVAIIFVLFDIEVVFIYPWAVLFKELGLFGLASMATFMLILGIGLIYVWKKGALEW